MTTEQMDEVDRIRAAELVDEPDPIGIPQADVPAIVYLDLYYPVAAYIADAALALAGTENHEDPHVRAVRKIAVQAIAALDQLITVDEPEEDTDPAAEAPATPAAKRAAIRRWAAENGIYVGDKGRIAQDVIDRYEAAQEAGR
jgi:hypothetical protein